MRISRSHSVYLLSWIRFECTGSNHGSPLALHHPHSKYQFLCICILQVESTAWIRQKVSISLRCLTIYFIWRLRLKLSPGEISADIKSQSRKKSNGSLVRRIDEIMREGLWHVLSSKIIFDKKKFYNLINLQMAKVVGTILCWFKVLIEPAIWQTTFSSSPTEASKRGSSIYRKDSFDSYVSMMRIQSTSVGKGSRISFQQGFLWRFTCYSA